MKSPKGYSEQEVLIIIERVVDRLAPSFVFGAYDTCDLKQEGRIFAIEALNGNKFDENRPLENFLYSHVRNRLINLRRNKFSRHEIPCKTCPFFDPNNKLSLCKNQCTAYDDKMECSRWEIYITRNEAKRNINEPIDLSDVDDESETNMKMMNDPAKPMVDNELMAKIDLRLDASLRSDFMKLMAGSPLPKKKRERVRAAVQEILDDSTES